MEKENILVFVDGGVAYVVEETVPKDSQVEIIDFDNLRDLGDSIPPRFSRRALEFIERESHELAAVIRSRRPSPKD